MGNALFPLLCQDVETVVPKQGIKAGVNSDKVGFGMVVIEVNVKTHVSEPLEWKELVNSTASHEFFG